MVVVGEKPHFSRNREPWFLPWAEFSVRRNVHAIGARSQQDLPGYYQAFDVILIPYATDDPFNRACSPTKIMDGMGSSRPIVATALPECRLYTELFDVAEDHESFLAAIKAILSHDSDDGRAGRRLAHALRNTCAQVGGRLLQILGQ